MRPEFESRSAPLPPNSNEDRKPDDDYLPRALRRYQEREKIMPKNVCATAALCAALAVSLATPAHAAGEILITHAKALAGNVTPGDPPGYPIVLTLPGSYQLASNLFTAANKITIQVTSDNVTIDLNGFTLQGSNVAFHGITGGVDGVTIKNGTITGFKFDGINGGTGSHWTVENMRVIENGRHGIFVDGFHTAIRSSMVAVNGDRGISCALLCLVEGSVVSENRFGIVMNNGSVLGSVIGNNAEFGIAGAFAGFGNNTLIGNNAGGGSEVSPGVAPMQPNTCGKCPV